MRRPAFVKLVEPVYWAEPSSQWDLRTIRVRECKLFISKFLEPRWFLRIWEIKRKMR